MICVEVRERLTEHALGLLDSEELWQIERHLEWCAGCRKESAELLEGVETAARALPETRPRQVLEERVVHEVLTAAGKRPRGARRQTVRVLAVATLAAASLALGAVGWGFAERQKARNLQAEVEQALSSAKGLSAVVNTLSARFDVAATGYQASLYPGVRQQPAGTAVVFVPARGSGFALVNVVTPLPAASGPFSVLLVDQDGNALAAGTLASNGSGRLVMANIDLSSNLSKPGSVDLAQLTALNVVDRSGKPVLTGTFRPYTAG